MNCLISGDWILPYQPLLLSASSAQSLNLMRWKLYSGTLIPLPWNCRPLPLWIRITVSWLPMALPALFSALRLSHHQTTTVDRHDVLDGIKNVYIGDRGYCSYNNMAHVVEQGSISCSVPRISIPKDWSAILIFQMRNPSILMSASYWSGAIRKKFWQTSTQKVTYALLIRQLLSITLNMEVMIHMSCPSVFYASLSALLHTSAS